MIDYRIIKETNADSTFYYVQGLSEVGFFFKKKTWTKLDKNGVPVLVSRHLGEINRPAIFSSLDCARRFKEQLNKGEIGTSIIK